MTAKERKPVAPFYAVAVLWLLGGIFLPLYSDAAIGLLAAASAIVFLAVDKLCKGAGTIAGSAAEEMKKEDPGKEAEPSTGDPELDRTIRDGDLALRELERLGGSIADPGVSADIARLRQVSEKIFQAVRDDPAKLPKIRQFMDYYLPTALKLLNAYDRMSGAGVSGENIGGTMARVENTMKTVVKAFEKQLDSLYGETALDISAEIRVMETLLAREGLKEQELKAGGVQPDGTDIGLEL